MSYTFSSKTVLFIALIALVSLVGIKVWVGAKTTPTNLPAAPEMFNYLCEFLFEGRFKADFKGRRRYLYLDIFGRSHRSDMIDISHVDSRSYSSILRDIDKRRDIAVAYKIHVEQQMENGNYLVNYGYYLGNLAATSTTSEFSYHGGKWKEVRILHDIVAEAEPSLSPSSIDQRHPIMIKPKLSSI